MYPAFFKIAGQQELEERRRLSTEFLNAEPKLNVPPAGHERGMQLSPELLSYLRLIAQTQGVSSSARDRVHHISPKKGVAFRQELIRRGLLVEVHIRDGVGRPVNDLQVTESGWKTIGKELERNSGQSVGGK